MKLINTIQNHFIIFSIFTRLLFNYIVGLQLSLLLSAIVFTSDITNDLASQLTNCHIITYTCYYKKKHHSVEIEYFNWGYIYLMFQACRLQLMKIFAIEFYLTFPYCFHIYSQLCVLFHRFILQLLHATQLFVPI